MVVSAQFGRMTRQIFPSIYSLHWTNGRIVKFLHVSELHWTLVSTLNIEPELNWGDECVWEHLLQNNDSLVSCLKTVLKQLSNSTSKWTSNMKFFRDLDTHKASRFKSVATICHNKHMLCFDETFQPVKLKSCLIVVIIQP